MKSVFELRSMQAADVAAVVHLQAACYAPALHESAAVIAARWQASPRSMWLLWQEQQAMAYLVCYPSQRGRLAELGAVFTPDPQPNCLYVHDLAVAPWAAGRGAAQQLLEHAFAWARQQGWQHSALVAVQQSQAFWQKWGYQPTVLPPAQHALLASYGTDAVYYSQTWPERD